MFETEANSVVKRISKNQIDSSVFLKKSALEKKSILSWGEHCTECAVPECYQTCSLYEATKDLRCRRFQNGIIKVLFFNHKELVNGYWLEIDFKKWSKFEANGSIKMFPTKLISLIEKIDSFFGKIVRNIPLPMFIRRKFIFKYWGIKENHARYFRGKIDARQDFVLEIYNPNLENTLNCTIRLFHYSDEKQEVERESLPYEKLLTLQHGYNLIKIPTIEISSSFDLNKTFRISFIPNNNDETIKLYLGLCDFVIFKNLLKDRRPAEKVKCVIWDLDNTIWQGTLIEDGIDNLKLNDDVKDVILELDKRGVLQSIASKNNYDSAIQALKKFNIEKYFLCPQINWEPKSLSIYKISNILNLDINSFLFIDDQEFERDEVRQSLNSIRIRHEKNISELLLQGEFDLLITETTKSRRKLYKEQSKRKIESLKYKDNYLEFLKDSKIEITLSKLKKENFDRAHELTQRTNQMNFSGTIYNKEKLNEIYLNQDLNNYIISCKDKYGDYGVVGFSIYNKKENIITDLMFSCRIQSKKIEHRFLTWIYEKNNKSLRINYKPTDKNKNTAQVFDDLGFIVIFEKNNIKTLELRSNQNLSNFDFIKITDNLKSK